MLEKVENIIRKTPGGKDRIMAVLHAVQAELGYISKDALTLISEKKSIPLAVLYRMVTTYKAFRTSKPGEHILTVCMGTCCHVKKSDELDKKIKSVSEKTGSEITVEKARCLGCCDMAPVVMIDGEVYQGENAQARISDILSE